MFEERAAGGFWALVVQASAESAERLVEELRRLGVEAEALTASQAATALGGGGYGALLFDDELPGGDSLLLLQALEDLGDRRPPVVLMAVARPLLAEARAATGEGVECVALPETPQDTQRLALRMRSRMLRAGLAGDFGTSARDGAARSRRGTRSRRSLAVVLALVALLLVAALLVQLARQGGGAQRSRPIPRPAPATVVRPSPPLPDGVVGVGAKITDFQGRERRSSRAQGGD